MFYLMNKDRIVCTFELRYPNSWETNCDVTSFNDVEFYKYCIHSLKFWLKRRLPDRDRTILGGLKSALDITNIYELISVTHLVSMRDTLWVTESPFIDKWTEVSPYTSNININIAKMTLNDVVYKYPSRNVVTPELTTDGHLPKCWSVVDENIFMLKRSSAKGSECVSEYLCSQLLEYLGIPHVNYLIFSVDERQYSFCSSFTSEDYGFRSAADFAAKTYSQLKALYSKFNALDYLRNIIVFDAIVLNPSRSFDDLGFIVDNNTGLIVKPAPVFDNGDALAEHRFNSFGYDAIQFINDKDILHAEQIKLCERVMTFEFTPNSKIGIGEHRAKYLTELIHQRADLLLKGLAERKEPA